MNTTAPKSLRLHIALFGRTNVGKSSFLNMVAGQDVAITSPLPGTTTDVVEKSMELLPVGPVLFLDTAGVDDASALAPERLRRTAAAFERAEVTILLVEPGVWTRFEDSVVAETKRRNLPLMVVINKTDQKQPSAEFLARLAAVTDHVMLCSSIGTAGRERYVGQLKHHLLQVCPDDYVSPPPLASDLVPSGGLAVLIVPIDLEAPKGRLILPQVQTIRDCLDCDAGALVVKEREYAGLLAKLMQKPDLVVCDSQVVMKMVADTPTDVPCTTFSILFARLKGDLAGAAAAAAVIDTLGEGDKVLITEACSHHALEDDIGRVKIPRWLRQYAGGGVAIDVVSGRDYPDNLSEYKLVIHCGGCMLTRREMLGRIERAAAAGVPVTNYGVAISFLQGVLPRVLSPFPAALDAYRRAADGHSDEKHKADTDSDG